ncbi:hypothetical protein [Empedobacter sedimenti]|uniref:hypothetical protein n=1 Tax=Empedobacter sedimenti TaxID=3042610 RepID=UPI0024A761B2|nr:hypothetical protein [Empedobacter sedimenti]
MEKKLYYLSLFCLLLSFSELSAQGINKNDTISLKILQDQQINLKNQNIELSKDNKRLLELIENQKQENLNTQLSLLQNNYELIKTSFNESDNVYNQITNYKTRIKDFGILLDVSKISTPTSTSFGNSFTSIILKNSDRYLTNNLSNSSKSSFLTTVDRIVKLPIVESVVNSNPVSSIIKDILTYSVSFNNNKIPSESISNFKNSLIPYINFYSGLDSNNAFLDKLLMDCNVDIQMNENSINRYNSRINEILKSTNTDKYIALDNLFKKNTNNKLSLEEIKKINNSRDIYNLVSLVNRTDIPVVNQDKLTTGRSVYIDKVIDLLTELKNSPNNDFNREDIEKQINNFKNKK